MEVTEGSVTIEVPERRDGSSDGTGDGVFYNPEMELNRDVTIAVLRAHRDRDQRSTKYLDPMTASGIRGVRAAASGFDVTCADIDPGAATLARKNLERNGLEGTVVEGNANWVMHDRDRTFDIVDLDPFGSPMPFADAALATTRTMVCVTATDTAPLCGAHFAAGVRRYDAVPRNTEYHPEMGLRVLVSALVRTAARHDRAARPICSHVSRHYVRTYLQLEASASAADDALDELGYVLHCQDCLERTTEYGRHVNPPDDGTCPHCGSGRFVVAGPLWLGPVADPDFVAETRTAVTDAMGEASRARRLLGTVETELETPTHYDQHRLCELWGRPASAMNEFLAALRDAGFAASRAHYSGTAFKTDASVSEIRAATADLV